MENPAHGRGRPTYAPSSGYIIVNRRPYGRRSAPAARQTSGTPRQTRGAGVSTSPIPSMSTVAIIPSNSSHTVQERLSLRCFSPATRARAGTRRCLVTRCSGRRSAVGRVRARRRRRDGFARRTPLRFVHGQPGSPLGRLCVAVVAREASALEDLADQLDVVASRSALALAGATGILLDPLSERGQVVTAVHRPSRAVGSSGVVGEGGVRRDHRVRPDHPLTVPAGVGLDRDRSLDRRRRTHGRRA